MANVKISSDPELLKLAAEALLGKRPEVFLSASCLGECFPHPGTKKRDPCLPAKVSSKSQLETSALSGPEGAVLTVRAPAAGGTTVSLSSTLSKSTIQGV